MSLQLEVSTFPPLTLKNVEEHNKKYKLDNLSYLHLCLANNASKDLDSLTTISSNYITAGESDLRSDQ